MGVGYYMVCTDKIMLKLLLYSGSFSLVQIFVQLRIVMLNLMCQKRMLYWYEKYEHFHNVKITRILLTHWPSVVVIEGRRLCSCCRTWPHPHRALRTESRHLTSWTCEGVWCLRSVWGVGTTSHHVCTYNCQVTPVSELIIWFLWLT